MPAASTLLEPDEPEAVEIVNGQLGGNLLLVCDHASHRIPHTLGNLGLGPEDLRSHIAWDIGAAAVARLLADKLACPLVLSGYSRLVIDCNRPLKSSDSIPQQSAGIAIPGNFNLSLTEQKVRTEQLFWPYHQAIDGLLDRHTKNINLSPLRILLSIHSFTPELHQQIRPWHIGVACRNDPRLAKLLHKALAISQDLIIGFNEPYIIDDNFDYTVPVQGEDRGLFSAMIEIRQDQIATEKNVAIWAERLAIAFRSIEAELI